MSEIRSYGKIRTLGHREIIDLFEGTVVVQEKIDGSQFSVLVTPDDRLVFRSKGGEFHPAAGNKLFDRAAQAFIDLYHEGRLKRGWTYRGEAVHAPRHNALTYGRAPDKGFVLYDIDRGLEDYLDPLALREHALQLGLEYAPLYYWGSGAELDLGTVKGYLEQESMLGGKIEGVVIKNYHRFAEDGKCLMGKFVSDDFKEIHKKSWKKDNLSNKDKLALVVEQFRTEARWQKAIIHLQERGIDTSGPECIGELLREVKNDLIMEAAPEIKDALYRAFRDDILRGATRGCPEWWKEKLAQEAFDHDSRAGDPVVDFTEGSD